MDCIVERDLNRHLAERDRRAAIADAIEAQAEERLEDPQFVWDFMGDIGRELQDQAVKSIIRAVMAEMKTNPALADRYRRLALKETQRSIEDDER